MMRQNWSILNAILKSNFKRVNFCCKLHNQSRIGPIGQLSRRIGFSRLLSSKRSISTSSEETTNFNDLFIHKTLSSIKSQDSEFIRCSIFDKDGDMILHGKEFIKSNFMKEYNLLPRDLRKISKHSHNTHSSQIYNIDIVPSLIVKNNSILLNLLNIKALIKFDSVIIFDQSWSQSATSSRLHESYSQSKFLKDMSVRLKTVDNENLPYEFKALETILINVVNNLTTEMKVHTNMLTNILNGLDTDIDRFKLRYLLIQSKKIAQFQQKVTLIRDLLEDILEQDDELNQLYLSEIHQNNLRLDNNHPEIEMLLESYYKTCDEIVQTTKNLKSQIKTTEEIINIVLDSNRNELMLLGLKFSTGLLSMCIALYVAALYGMNLENFIEETDGGFEVVVAFSTILLALLLAFSIKQLRKVEKITMTSVKSK